ncbi:NUDIX hydrolase [Streptomyces sp. NPDC057575]|uniref:NUDIX hydrolase n=1 Tax=unclassified Streptomyces TaxID=2593676 RepID=UPI003689A3B1
MGAGRAAGRGRARCCCPAWPRADDQRGVREAAAHGHALTGALSVVIDEAGRLLLGRSTRGMRELPGGRTSGSEDFASAAERELREETGLIAPASDAYAVAMLADDRHGVWRLTAAGRPSSEPPPLIPAAPHRPNRREHK